MNSLSLHTFRVQCIRCPNYITDPNGVAANSFHECIECLAADVNRESSLLNLVRTDAEITEQTQRYDNCHPDRGNGEHYATRLSCETHHQLTYTRGRRIEIPMIVYPSPYSDGQMWFPTQDLSASRPTSHHTTPTLTPPPPVFVVVE
jgi:hypothetical protein